MPRDRNDPTQPRMLAAAQREKQALQLRISGASVTDIAETLGITPSAVSKCIARALAKARPDAATVEQMRQLQMARIEARRLDGVRMASRHHPVLHQGVPVSVTGPDGVDRELEDDGPRVAALGVVRDADRDLAALLGLNAATRWEGEASIEVVSRESRIASLLERAQTARLKALPSANGEYPPPV
jgi:hypothetical protein